MYSTVNKNNKQLGKDNAKECASDVVGKVVAIGKDVGTIKVGQIVGIAD